MSFISLIAERSSSTTSARIWSKSQAISAKRFPSASATSAVAVRGSWMAFAGPRPAKPTIGIPTGGVMSARAVPIRRVFIVVPSAPLFSRVGEQA